MIATTADIQEHLDRYRGDPAKLASHLERSHHEHADPVVGEDLLMAAHSKDHACLDCGGGYLAPSGYVPHNDKCPVAS